MNDMESRFDLRGRIPPFVVLVEDCRGSREFEVDGDDRRRDWCIVDLGVVLSSITPNSEVDKAVGEGLADVGANPLARRDACAEVEFLSGGEGLAEAALEIRGILVGVSLGNPETVLREEFEGSRLSLVN